MGRAIAICNQKGGVGKSTTAVNLGAFLAYSGKRTLLFDLDAQGNASTACGVSRKNLQQDIYSVLTGRTQLATVILRTPVEHFDIVPASLDLAGAEPFLSALDQKEGWLKTVCTQLSQQYEFLLFDCPPSLALMTVNALVAADSVLVPVQCEYLALEGLNALMQAIGLIRQRLNPTLKTCGILLTMTDFRANLAREVANDVRCYFKELVFESMIPRNIRLAESPSFGKPILLYDIHSAGALAYRMLAEEVMLRELGGQMTAAQSTPSEVGASQKEIAL